MKIKEVKKNIFSSDNPLDTALEFIYTRSKEDGPYLLHICRRISHNYKGTLFYGEKIAFDYFGLKCYYCPNCLLTIGFDEFPEYRTNCEGNA
mgnify:CR=1 FL=1